MKGLALAGVITWALTATACYWLTPYEDLTSGGDVAPRSAPDAALDASSYPSFCSSLQPAPLFCDDFDEGQPFDAGWTDAVVAGGAQLALDTTTKYSGVASLLATAGGVGSHAYVEYDLKGQWTSAHFELELLPLTIPAVQAGAVTLFAIGQGGRDLVLYLAAGTPPYFQEEPNPDGGAPQFNYLMDASVNVGTWQKWSVDVTATPPSVTVTIDGAAPQSFPLLFGWQPNAPLFLQVGDLYNYRDQPATAAFDNVVVDLR